jgi:hypothetical protein
MRGPWLGTQLGAGDYTCADRRGQRKGEKRRRTGEEDCLHAGGSGMNKSGKYFIDSHHLTGEAGTVHCGNCGGKLLGNQLGQSNTTVYLRRGPIFRTTLGARQEQRDCPWPYSPVGDMECA